MHRRRLARTERRSSRREQIHGPDRVPRNALNALTAGGRRGRAQPTGRPATARRLRGDRAAVAAFAPRKVRGDARWHDRCSSRRARPASVARSGRAPCPGPARPVALAALSLATLCSVATGRACSDYHADYHPESPVLVRPERRSPKVVCRPPRRGTGATVRPRRCGRARRGGMPAGDVRESRQSGVRPRGRQDVPFRGCASTRRAAAFPTCPPSRALAGKRSWRFPRAWCSSGCATETPAVRRSCLAPTRRCSPPRPRARATSSTWMPSRSTARRSPKVPTSAACSRTPARRPPSGTLPTRSAAKAGGFLLPRQRRQLCDPAPSGRVLRVGGQAPTDGRGVGVRGERHRRPPLSVGQRGP